MAEKLTPTEQYKSIPDSPVTPAPSQWFPQDVEDKPADPNFNGTSGWVRGMSKDPHPKFDKGPSGNRYRS